MIQNRVIPMFQSALPLHVSQWEKPFEQIAESISKVVAGVGVHHFKLHLIKTQLDLFWTSLKERRQLELNKREAIMCYKFLSSCTAFIGIASRYQTKVWLKYFLESTIDQSVKDLMKVWNIWSQISTSFRFKTFESRQSLYYAHSQDLQLVYRILYPKISSLPDSIRLLAKERCQAITDIVFTKPVETEETNKFILKHDDFTMGEQIGTGGFATVYRAVYSRTGESVAVKELLKTEIGTHALADLRRELTALSVLNHPNVIKFFGVTVTPPFRIVTELMNNGTLFDILHQKEAPSPTLLSKFAVGIARGLEYIHACGMIHRDIKSSNIFISEDFRPVIADFGLTRRIGNNMTHEIGTLSWMAPEMMIHSCDYDQMIDVYAFGVTLWEMIALHQPFQDLSLLQIVFGVVNQEMRPEIPESTPRELSKLISLCWHQIPTKRPKMSKVRALLESGKCCFAGTDMDEFTKWVEKTHNEHRQVMARFKE